MFRYPEIAGSITQLATATSFTQLAAGAAMSILQMNIQMVAVAVITADKVVGV